jgi:hypothetical protein
MAFGKITAALAIPTEATATFVFSGLSLHPSGPPTLVCRHAGDGNRLYMRALERSINADRARGESRGPAQYSRAKLVDQTLDEAALIAEHCVVSWTGVYDDGEAAPSPCTPAKVLEFLSALIRADGGLFEYRAFAAWISSANTFRAPAGDPVELGKA